MDIHEAFAWYDRAIDNAIDYLNLDREEQDKAWNVIDKFIDEAIAHKSVASDEVAEAIEWIRNQRADNLANLMIESVDSADLAITALQAYQPWIPCTERMPTEDDADEDGFVLTLDADRQQTDYPHSEIESWNNRCDVKITHWRPMLPIPKGE